jgi:hypothetical protein
LIIHTGGACKKAKMHKTLLEYTITEDDMDFMVERFHDREVEEFKDTQHQRDRIQDELVDMR